MAGDDVRPVLFLDIDGTLIPVGAPPTDSGLAGPDRGADRTGNPLLGRLNRDHGAQLLALRVELVWATSWTDDANDDIAPRLGLPLLPVVPWPDADDTHGHVHWKTPHLVAWAKDRPFVWVDDELTDADRAWVVAHHPAPALLHRVAPTIGLTDADFAVITRWLESL